MIFKNFIATVLFVNNKRTLYYTNRYKLTTYQLIH